MNDEICPVCGFYNGRHSARCDLWIDPLAITAKRGFNFPGYEGEPSVECATGGDGHWRCSVVECGCRCHRKVKPKAR